MRERRALSARQRGVLERVRSRPPLTNIRWREVVSLLGALGCSVEPVGGSRYGITGPNGAKFLVHRPHPESNVGRSLITRLQEFLEVIDD